MLYLPAGGGEIQQKYSSLTGITQPIYDGKRGKNMKNYGLNELREMFLSFFETKGHLRLPSFSLIPQNDASLLLINSGMAPMKPWGLHLPEVHPHRRHRKHRQDGPPRHLL